MDLLARRDITFAVSRAHPAFLGWLKQYELLALIDPKRFFPTNRHAALAFRGEQAKRTLGAPGTSGRERT
jgi:hypothetical protein